MHTLRLADFIRDNHEPILKEWEAFARTLKPDILLVDVTMPKLNGVQVTAQLSRELPSMRIVGLSMHERQDMAAAMRTAEPRREG